MLQTLWDRSRPRFHLYLLGPVLLGIAVGSASLETMLRWDVLSTLLYFWFPANYLLYAVNDWFDREMDAENEKKQGYERSIDTDTTPQSLRQIFIAILIIGILSVVYAAGLSEGARGYLLGFLVLSIGYSMPPLRFKTRPVLDSSSNLLYAIPGFLTYFLLTGSHPSWEWWLLATAWNMGMHTFSAIPDIGSDRAAGIETTATWLGAQGAAYYVFGCWLLTAVLALPVVGIWAVPLLLYPFLAAVVASDAEPISRSWELYRFFPVLNGLLGLYGFWAMAYDSGLVRDIVRIIESM